MNVRSFRAWWSIERQAAYVADLDRGSVDYGSCPFLYGWDMEHLGIAFGDYKQFRTGGVASDIIPGYGGPIDICESTTYEGDFGAYGSAFSARASAVLELLMEDSWGISSSYDGLIMVDLEVEAWPPFWRRTIAVPGDPFYLGSTYFAPWSLERHWRAYVRSHVTDITGLTNAQWDALEPAEQEDWFESTFLSRSRTVYAALFAAVRSVLPNARISDWGWPQKHYYELNPANSAPRQADLIRSNTLQIPWMSKHWDYLAPWMYPVTRAVAPGAILGSKDESEASWMENYGRICEEILRVRTLCGGLPTYCNITPSYEVPESSELFEASLNALTARLQVEICRTYGLDGVIMWGAIVAPDGDPDPAAYAAARRAAMQVGLDVMQPLIKAYMDGLDDIFVAINSPIAIGPLG